MRRSVPGCPRPLRGGSTCLALPLETLFARAAVSARLPQQVGKASREPSIHPGASFQVPPPQPRSKPHKKRGPERRKTVGKQEGKEEKAGKLRSAVGLKGLRDILSQGRFAFQGQEFVSVWADSWLNYEDSRGHAFRFQRITWP